MKIAGWVRNLPTGEVEAEAQADEVTLQAYEAKLQKGPALARVQQVAIQDLPVNPSENKAFEIRR